MTFKVESSGWYRTRDGRLAEVVVSNLDSSRAVIGYIMDHDYSEEWGINGRYLDPYLDSKIDLIEYLGKERPKQPKKFKVKARLYNNGEIVVDDDNACFVNVLRIVETREIEWEVPGNG
tara:strand:- start:44 stop:400 length:357 start_codon:yes stop_codon:yes gene_type:complete